MGLCGPRPSIPYFSKEGLSTTEPTEMPSPTTLPPSADFPNGPPPTTVSVKPSENRSRFLMRNRVLAAEPSSMSDLVLAQSVLKHSGPYLVLADTETALIPTTSLPPFTEIPDHPNPPAVSGKLSESRSRFLKRNRVPSVEPSPISDPVPPTKLGGSSDAPSAVAHTGAAIMPNINQDIATTPSVSLKHVFWSSKLTDSML